MRPYWKGYLKLALVSCPIALHAACSGAERIALQARRVRPWSRRHCGADRSRRPHRDPTPWLGM